MVVIAKDRQSLLDVAIQVLGSPTGVFVLAERNGISITDRLTDGQQLTYDLADIEDTRTADMIAARGICPATDIPPRDEKNLLARVAALPPMFEGLEPGHLKPLVPLVRPDILPNIGTMYDSGVTTLKPKTVGVTKAEENVLDKTFNEAKKAAAKNEAPPSESGQAVTDIFSNQFNDTFA